MHIIPHTPLFTSLIKQLYKNLKDVILFNLIVCGLIGVYKVFEIYSPNQLQPILTSLKINPLTLLTSSHSIYLPLSLLLFIALIGCYSLLITLTTTFYLQLAHGIDSPLFKTLSIVSLKRVIQIAASIGLIYFLNTTFALLCYGLMRLHIYESTVFTILLIVFIYFILRFTLVPYFIIDKNNTILDAFKNSWEYTIPYLITIFKYVLLTPIVSLGFWKYISYLSTPALIAIAIFSTLFTLIFSYIYLYIINNENSVNHWFNARTKVLRTSRYT